MVDKLESLQEFCYQELGDMFFAGGGCKTVAVTHCNCEWGNFLVDLRMGVLNMCEECDAACIKEMSNDNRQLETQMGKQERFNTYSRSLAWLT